MTSTHRRSRCHGESPGEVIWIEPIEAPARMLAWKVLYHSQSIDGSDIAVSGFVVAPDDDPPEDGWPVIAVGHGTTGLADVCAPSRDPNLLENVLSRIPELFGFPYVVTATDYEGLGTPGHHPYIVGESEARSVLDSVKAARAIEAAHASNRFVVWGQSQGGHAALFAGRLARDWTPELDLIGIAAVAPPSQFGVMSDTLSGSYFRGYLPMVIESYAETYPEAEAEAALTAAALERIAVLDESCADEIMNTYASLDAIVVDQSLWDNEPWRSLVELNEPGRGEVEAPVLIIHGGDDEQVPVETSAALFEGLVCSWRERAAHRISWAVPQRSHLRFSPRSVPVDTRSVRGGAVDQRVRKVALCSTGDSQAPRRDLQPSHTCPSMLLSGGDKGLKPLEAKGQDGTK